MVYVCDVQLPVSIQRRDPDSWYKSPVSLPPLTTGKFRWDRLTYSSALGYALLAGGQSIGFVLGELRHQFRLSGVTSALHGSVFGLTALTAGLCGVPVVDRLGRRTSLVVAAVAIGRASCRERVCELV